MALHALLEIEQEGALADDVLDKRFEDSGLDVRDRALAFELVYGVLRHQATLDWRLNRVATKSMVKLPARVRVALRLGAYQLLYLDKIPASAAVNESVALMKPLRGSSGHWPGFVNAVLRAFTRTPVPDWPDPVATPVEALSIRYSCPVWLTERWVARFGTDGAADLCRATTMVPPLTLRANTLRSTREALTTQLQRAGYEASATTVSPVGVRVEKSGPITELPLFRDGAFYVEDEAAQLVATILDPQPGERILDACAAPGGKTTHLAALMQNRGEIVAMDRSVTRLRQLGDNCRRLGITIVKPLRADATRELPRTDALTRSFDRILVDAPCSGLGVLRRHPEGKWRKDAGSLSTHHATQVMLLERVHVLLRPGGVLVYSTCSSEPEENEQVIDDFCRKHAEFQRESVAPWLPASGQPLITNRGEFSTVQNADSMDIFFAARFRKATAR